MSDLIMDGKTDQNGFNPDVNSKGFLEMIPSAAAIWNSPRTISAFNQSVQHLIGFTEADLSVDNQFLSKRVYCSDRNLFSERQMKMECGVPEITCAYRICPKGRGEPVRIRDVILSLRDPNLNWKWISLFSEMSECNKPTLKEGNDLITNDLHEIIGHVFHEIKNRLHFLNMEIELAVMESGDSIDAKKFVDALHGVTHSIKLLQDYLMPGRGGLASLD